MKKANKRSGRSSAKSTKPVSVAKAPALIDQATLLSDLRTLIQSARQRIATAAYSTQTLLCWHVGRRLLNENLQGGRAAYGKQILVTLSQQLSWSHVHALLPLLRARLHQAIERAREQAVRRLPDLEDRR